jgi:hypothetical protein
VIPWPQQQSIILRIELVRFGPPTTAEWCPNCLLPSAVTQRIATVHAMSVLGMQDVTVCDECQTYRIENLGANHG